MPKRVFAVPVPSALPIVAIIGRQNVGKSTLLNRLAGHQLAITEDEPGTTRDRIFAPVTWGDRGFILVDTGGLMFKDTSDIGRQVRAQVAQAVDEADLLLFVLDAKDGIAPGDAEIAQMARQSGKPVLVAANKVDNEKLKAGAAEFNTLGLGEPVAVSAYHGLGMNELRELIADRLPPAAAPAATGENTIGVAIIGRTNVGKSTLLNTLLGQSRAVVSETPGTTRDAIDTRIDFGGQGMVLIDTAGIRRRGKVAPGIENYSVIRSLRAIERADIVLLVLDATESSTAQDSHIAGLVRDTAKGIIIVVNKWDLLPDTAAPGIAEGIRRIFNFIPYAPVLHVSARTGFGVNKLLPGVIQIFQERIKQVAPEELASFQSQTLAAHAPPRHGQRQLKIYRIAQSAVNPPTFTFTVNDADLVHFSYKRYLENRFREAFGFDGTPIRLLFKARGEKC